MIDAQGWLSWAERLVPEKQNVNPGVNDVRGVFLHSAEGYASVLLDPRSQYGYNGRHSWHASNLMDGRMVQHYPFTARCWHATAANDHYVGIENEGYQPNEPSLTEAQVANAARLIGDLAAWKGWEPSRTGDVTQTCWEHNEVVWLGGTGSQCPSGRIPWDEILSRLQGGDDDMAFIVGHPDNPGDHIWLNGKLQWIPDAQTRDELLEALYRAPGQKPPRLSKATWDFLQAVQK